MICVIASIKVREGARERFLVILKENVPKVRQEDGCIEYFPAVDVDASIAVQQMDETVVTVVEKWQSAEAFHSHLVAPHMLEYRERVKDLVENVSLKVLQEAP